MVLIGYTLCLPRFARKNGTTIRRSRSNSSDSLGITGQTQPHLPKLASEYAVLPSIPDKRHSGENPWEAHRNLSLSPIFSQKRPSPAKSDDGFSVEHWDVNSSMPPSTRNVGAAHSAKAYGKQRGSSGGTGHGVQSHAEGHTFIPAVVEDPVVASNGPVSRHSSAAAGSKSYTQRGEAYNEKDSPDYFSFINGWGVGQLLKTMAPTSGEYMLRNLQVDAKEECPYCRTLRIGGGFIVLGYGKICQHCGNHIDVDLGTMPGLECPP